MFLMGSDPEFVVFKDGEIRSAISVLPENSKENRLNLGCGEVFYDNVQIEMNIPPASTAGEFIDNVASIFREVNNTIRPYKFLPIASAVFPESELKHEDAMEFGCDPEFCAYLCATLEAPKPSEIGGFRSAGGHIHLGESEKGSFPLRVTPVANDPMASAWPRLQVVRAMDVLVGLTSVVLDTDPTSAARRRLYGKAGSHRPKEYGVEYRSAGNFWYKSPRLVSLIFDLSKLSVELVESKHFENKMCARDSEPKYSADLVRKAIDETNVDLAKTLMEDLVKPLIPAKLYRTILHLSGVKFGPFNEEWNIR